MGDKFRDFETPLHGPFDNAADVTPSDSADLATPSRALYCLGPGNVRVTLVGSGTVTLPMVVGVPLVGRIRRVWATSTTATGIVAVW